MHPMSTGSGHEERKVGTTMSSSRWTGSGTQTVSPEEHAILVASDRHLAAQAYQFLVLGDTPDALRIVADEARDIQALCTYMPVTSPTGTNRSLVDAMRSIEEVGDRCTQQGDAIQAMWCRMLNHRLEGEQ